MGQIQAPSPRGRSRACTNTTPSLADLNSEVGRLFQRLSESRERRICLMSSTTNGVCTVASSSCEYKHNINVVGVKGGELVSGSVSVTRTTQVVVHNANRTSASRYQSVQDPDYYRINRS